MDQTGAIPPTDPPRLPSRREHIFIVSAPSGAGKTTLCRAALNRLPDLSYSVSYTTRLPRPGEVDGRDYAFISIAEFEEGIDAGRWAEWARVHGNYYGTSADVLNRAVAAGRDILLDIDVQGAQQIRSRFPRSVSIFIMPPSLDILAKRLQARGRDDPEDMALRLRNAREEMAQKEAYDHVIVNDRLETAVEELIAVIESRRRE
ncbi:MAG: guanylate kinase [Hyphomicrobiales bacterium]